MSCNVDWSSNTQATTTNMYVRCDYTGVTSTGHLNTLTMHYPSSPNAGASFDMAAYPANQFASGNFTVDEDLYAGGCVSSTCYMSSHGHYVTSGSNTFSGPSTCTWTSTDFPSTAKVCTVSSQSFTTDSYPAHYPDGDPPGPTACLTASPSAPDVGQSTTLDTACSTGSSPTSYAWTGCSSSSSTCTRSWASVGSYNVSVTLSNSHGSSTASLMVVVGGSNPGTGSSCRGWWDLICELKELFLPNTTDLSSSWDTFYGTTADHWPVGPFLWAGHAVSTFSGTFVTDATGDYGTEGGHGCTWGPTIDIPGSGGSYNLPVIDDCPTSSSAWVNDVRPVVFNVSTVLIVVGGIAGLARLVGLRFGAGGGGGGDDEGDS